MNPRLEPLVAQIVADRAQFERFSRSLTEEQLNRPVPESEWWVRDYIAHLATIDRTVQVWWEGLVARHERGEVPPGAGAAGSSGNGGGFDINAWNNRQAAKRRDRTVGELLEEARENRAPLLRVVEDFGDRTLDAEIDFPDPTMRRDTLLFGAYLVAWAAHDAAHSRDMLRALPELRGDSEVQRWVDGTRFQTWPPSARV